MIQFKNIGCVVIGAKSLIDKNTTGLRDYGMATVISWTANQPNELSY